MKHRMWLFLSVNVVCLLLTAGAARVAAQKPQNVIGQILVEGDTRFSPAQIALASGLKIGEPADDTILSAVANRLAKTGVFAELAYRYKTMNGKMIVTFQVKDDPKTLKGSFDNFVWFSQQEVEKAVRAEVPLYDGKMPFDSELPQNVATALEHLLAQHRLVAKVTFVPASPAIGTPPTEIRFSAEGNLPNVTSVEFTGGPLDDSLFSLQRQRLVGRPFSAGYAHSMAVADLDVIYQNRAYLRAHFSDPQVTFASGANDSDPGSVKLVFTVEPGPQFQWHGADWDGNSVYPTADLTAYLAMKDGDLAAADKISAGEDAIREAYGKQGYITASLSHKQTLDDAARQVHYSYQVKEGGQFHMGTFYIAGYDESTADKIRRAWRLKPGEVYDASFLKDFSKKPVPAPAGAGAKTRLSYSMLPNMNTLVVDVTLTAVVN